MAASSSDFFAKVGSPGSATTLAAPGHTIGGTTFNVVSTANWSTDTAVVFAVDQYDIATGARVAGTYTEWEGVVSSSTSITGAVLRYGNDQNYSAGSTTRVYIPVASSQVNRQVDGLLVSLNQDGTLKTTAVQTALNSGNLTNTGFNPLGFTPNTVTYNGNRSYSCVFNSTNLTGVLSPGMRLRTTRTVAAPTQATSLNGTTQYWSKTAPAGMTFTDDFTVSAWVKLNAYGQGVIINRRTADQGWILRLDPNGIVQFLGLLSAGNSKSISSYQSVPLNKWVHIAATLDMSASGGAIYIDGVLVPATFIVNGVASTITNTGDFAIGRNANTGTDHFNGKIAQAAVFSSILSAATIQSYYSQGIDPAAPTLISAYSFNGNANDLNTTNANNLTANGGATATNADSPFGGQADGTISSTLDYGIIQKATFSTNTTVIVQVAEGCTIPTSGGVAAVAYSSQKVPFGFPADVGKWTVETLTFATRSLAGTANTWYEAFSLTIPVGTWTRGYNASTQHSGPTAVVRAIYTTLSITSAAESEDLVRLTRVTASNTSELYGSTYAEAPYTTATATTNYLNVRVGSQSTSANGLGIPSPSGQAGMTIFARNALL